MDSNLPATLIHNGMLHSKTASVCPVCLKRIDALILQKGNDLNMQKDCPEHGHFEVVIRRGDIESVLSAPQRVPAFPVSPSTEKKQGCPYDCGLCPEHRQQPCCVLLEVTQRCDLSCPVCYASAGTNHHNQVTESDPNLDSIKGWYQTLLSAGGPYNIQLSGGEPCLRDDLPEIIAMGKELGFTFFQVNTNGMRIARDRAYLSRLKESGLSTVYLQFDGTTDEIFSTLRGGPLFDQKIAAIQNCRDLNIGVVLVPTVKPGVNDQEIGNIIRFALKYHPVVRGVHFQPMSYFGRYPVEPTDSDRITLPEIIQAIQDQSNGVIHKDWFGPSGGPNRYCSFNGNFVVMEDGTLKPIIKRKDSAFCSPAQDAEKERIKAQSFVARNWVSPPSEAPETKVTSKSGFGGWDSFLSRAKTHLFAISGMAFQDAWNLDLDRLHDCYIMVISPDNRLIPFCAYNLTDRLGKSIYRDQESFIE
jgi:7,8-dihydro-6-hydroxymethylpterin dimethyltransferase